MSEPLSLPTTPDGEFPVQSELAKISAELSLQGSPTGETSIQSEFGVNVAAFDLPSAGSVGHFTGQCKRCCFQRSGRCQNGYNCEFCHFDHERLIRKKKKKSASKAAWGHEENPNSTKTIQDSLTWNASNARHADPMKESHMVGFSNKTCRKEPLQVPPPLPPGLSFQGVEMDLYPPPGLDPTVDHLATPPPGLEQAATAFPPAGVPAPPPQLPPVSPFAVPVVPEVPSWCAVGAPESNSEPFVPEPPSWHADLSLTGHVMSSQALNPGQCHEAFLPFADPVMWSCEMVLDWLHSNDLSFAVACFAQHRITGDLLVRLTSEDLYAMGISAMGDRKRILRGIGGLQSGNQSWQQVDNLNWLDQMNTCQLPGDTAATIWNGSEEWLQDPKSRHRFGLSQQHNLNGQFCPPQQLSSQFNSDAYQELEFHHNLGFDQGLRLSDDLRHGVGYQESPIFPNNCGQSHSWSMQTSSRQASRWKPAFFAPRIDESY